MLKKKLYSIVMVLILLMILIGCKERYKDISGNIFFEKEGQLYITPSEPEKIGELYKIFLYNETENVMSLKGKFKLKPGKSKIINSFDTISIDLDIGVKFVFGEYGLEVEDKKNQISGLGGSFLEKYNVPDDIEWAFVIVPFGEGDKIIETAETKEIKSKTTKINTVDETGYKSFDASEYESLQLLIGKSETFKKEKIRNLNTKGTNSYTINHQGLITARYDITNNYSEYTYTQSGLLKTIMHKQHTPALTYYTKELFYKKDGSILKAVITRYDQQTKETTKETITDVKALQKGIPYFRGIAIKEPFKINREKRIMLTYGHDLVFCCGELMPRKNSLHYYYSENELIDSLVINGLESGKKMVFEYEYTFK